MSGVKVFGVYSSASTMVPYGTLKWLNPATASTLFLRAPAQTAGNVAVFVVGTGRHRHPAGFVAKDIRLAVVDANHGLDAPGDVILDGAEAGSAFCSSDRRRFVVVVERTRDGFETGVSGFNFRE